MGDQWVFVGIDAETKLIPTFHIGKRQREDTMTFLWDLYARIEGRTQITTDGLYHYKGGVPECFGEDADFAQLVKLFGDYGQHDSPDARYSPPRIMEVISKVRTGNPDPDHISTQLCRAPESHDAHGDPPIYAPDECFQQKTAQPEGRRRVAFRLLQLLPRAFKPSRYSRHGSRNH